jgi:hypothetical protein
MKKKRINIIEEILSNYRQNKNKKRIMYTVNSGLHVTDMNKYDTTQKEHPFLKLFAHLNEILASKKLFCAAFPHIFQL